MDDQRRFTISVSSTHPTPGEDIHHTGKWEIEMGN